MSTNIIPETREKESAWVREYDLDFNTYGEFSDDSFAITGTPTITFAPVDGYLTVGAPSVGPSVATDTDAVDSIVQVQVSGGRIGETYTVVCTVTATDGTTTVVLTRRGKWAVNQ